MLRVRTYLAPRAIDGIGLFAAEPIKRGTVVWRRDERFDHAYDLRELPDGDDPLLRGTFETYGYRPDDTPVYVLCADDARFMNHSPTANLEEIGDLSIARTDIAIGEEITRDRAKRDRGFAEREFVKLYARKRGRRAA